MRGAAKRSAVKPLSVTANSILPTKTCTLMPSFMASSGPSKIDEIFT